MGNNSSKSYSRKFGLLLTVCTLTCFRSVLAHRRVTEWELRSLNRKEMFRRWRNLKYLAVIWGMPFSPCLLVLHILAIQFLLWKCLTMRGGRFVYIPALLSTQISNIWAYNHISWAPMLDFSLPSMWHTSSRSESKHYSLIDFLLQHVDSMPAEVLQSAESQLSLITGACVTYAAAWIMYRSVLNGDTFSRVIGGLEIHTGTGACGVTAGLAALVGYMLVGIIRNESTELSSILKDIVQNFEHSRSEQDSRALVQKLQQKFGSLILREQLQARLQEPWDELRILTTFCASRAVFQIFPIPLRWMKDHRISAWSLLESVKWASCLIYVTSMTQKVSHEIHRLNDMIEDARSRILETMLTSERGDEALRVSLYLKMVQGKIANNKLSLPELDFLLWLQNSRGPKWIVLFSGSVVTVMANLEW